MRSVRTAVSLGIILVGCLPAQDGELSGARPNIVFVFSDDHAAHAISAYGSTINATPNLDRLAAEGLLFRNAFCGNSICGPSRATILTGLHSHANGFRQNGDRFDGDQRTFPKMLQAVGYQTALIGKWHLNSDPQGFDHWMILPGQGQYYNPDFITENGRRRIEGYCTDLTTDLALEWLDEQRDPDRPFLLMCQHKAPHRTWMPGPEELGLFREDVPEPSDLFDTHEGRGPAATAQEMEIARHLYRFYDLQLRPTEEEGKDLVGPDRGWRRFLERMTPAQREAWDAAFLEENRAFREAKLEGEELVRWKYQRYIKNYLRCVAGVDKNVGRLLAWLDARPEVAARTIFVYSSDQGFYLGDKGWYDKRWMYEESLRMPLLVRWPGAVRANDEVAALVQNIDFGPTFLDLAGVEVPKDMHGRSLVPLLQDETVPTDWRDAIYYRYYESRREHRVPAHYGVRTARYKLIHYHEPEWGYWELFDLDRDPREQRNLADDPAFADVRRSLTKRLTGLQDAYGDR